MAVRTKEKKSPLRKVSAGKAGFGGALRGANAATTSYVPTREMAPIILAAEKTFRRELPKLLGLRNPRRQWVAYLGERRLGYAATKHELYKRCLRQGIERGDLYVRSIAPETQEAEILFDV